VLPSAATEGADSVNCKAMNKPRDETTPLRTNVIMNHSPFGERFDPS
jgi:hypothetical protein